MPPAFTDVCTTLPTALPTVQETGCVSVHVTAGFPELARIQSAEIGSVVVALYCCLMILPPYLSPTLPTLPPVFPFSLLVFFPLSLPPSPSFFLPSLPYAHPFSSHYFPPFLLPSPPPSFYFQFPSLPPSFILSFFLFSPLFFQLFLPLLFFLLFSTFFKHLVVDTLSSKFGCLHGWKNQSVGHE